MGRQQGLNHPGKRRAKEDREPQQRNVERLGRHGSALRATTLLGEKNASRARSDATQAKSIVDRIEDRKG